MSINKIAAFPISKVQNKKSIHSKKLEFALRNFITGIGGSYYDDELNQGILTCYFKLENEICVEQKIQIGEKDYICDTTLSYSMNPLDDVAITSLLAVINTVNCEINYGYLFVNRHNGDIVFRSSYEPGNVISMESLDKMLGYPRHAINQYSHLLLSVFENEKMKGREEGENNNV